jgi:F0F1-type ATP synthase assembly protein I
MVRPSLFLTFVNDGGAILPHAATSVDSSQIALSMDDLRVLKSKLQAQGGSLRQFLASRDDLQLRFVNDASTSTELFEDDSKNVKSASAELEARREYLKKRAEERTYANLIASVQQDEIKERNRESFASYRQQASIGMNFLIGLLTAVLAGYLIGRVYDNGQHVRPVVTMLLLVC